MQKDPRWKYSRKMNIDVTTSVASSTPSAMFSSTSGKD